MLWFQELARSEDVEGSPTRPTRLASYARDPPVTILPNGPPLHGNQKVGATLLIDGSELINIGGLTEDLRDLQRDTVAVDRPDVVREENPIGITVVEEAAVTETARKQAEGEGAFARRPQRAGPPSVALVAAGCGHKPRVDATQIVVVMGERKVLLNGVGLESRRGPECVAPTLGIGPVPIGPLHLYIGPEAPFGILVEAQLVESYGDDSGFTGVHRPVHLGAWHAADVPTCDRLAHDPHVGEARKEALMDPRVRHGEAVSTPEKGMPFLATGLELVRPSTGAQ
jgi:hypothetical protein